VTLDAWGTAADALPPARRGVHVQTRPPIHWLRFDRAADAIAAGDAALETAWPGFGRRLAAWAAGGALGAGARGRPWSRARPGVVATAAASPPVGFAS
jgi:hypothetical protein